MADLQSNLNDNLIAAGLNANAPAQTYTDFSAQISKNQQEQAAQEQALELAKQHVAQAKMQTQQQQEAQDSGYNALLADSMTPEQAAAYVKLIFKEKGLTVDQADIDAWKATLPAQVNRQEVEAFASRFARETTRSGQPAMFGTDQKIIVPIGSSAADLGLEDMKDSDGNSVGDQTKSDGTFSAHVPDDGMYQVIYDNQGRIQKLIPGGKEPVDNSAKIALKQGESAEKQWQKLDKEVNTFLKSTRGNQLTTAIFRSDRALNELANSEVLVPQVLSYIGKDLSGIFQGGVPPQSAMADEDFSTSYQKINGLIQKYTGVSGFLHTDVGNQRQYLLSLVTRLRDSTLDILKSQVASEEAGYAGIIHEDPDRWQKMVTDKIAAVTSGLTATAQAASDASAAPKTATNIPGVKLGAKAAPVSKAVPKYTVE